MAFREYTTVRDASGQFSTNLALISAEHKDRKEQLNSYRTERLKEDILEAGFGCIHTPGFWKNRQENSYLIIAAPLGREKFNEYLLHWLRKYEQESALVRYANDDTAWMLHATGNEDKCGSWSKDVMVNYGNEA